MKKTTIIGLLVLFCVYSCKDQEELPYEPLEELKEGIGVQNERILLHNQPIELLVSETIPGTSAANNLSSESSESSPDFDCDESITESFSGNKRVNNREVICLEANTSFNGSLELRGGTFVVKGNATLTAINGNKGTILVTETGSLSMPNINLNNNFELINYGSDLSVTNLTVSGEFENYGTISIGKVTVNGGAKLKNEGDLTVENDFNINNDVENKGSLLVKGNLVINGGAELENKCKLIVEGNLQNNKTLDNAGYVKVGGTLTLNGGAKVKFDPQAYLIARNLTLNGSLEGSNDDYARVDIEEISLINWGARVTKKLDINDTNGFETNNGNFDSSVTLDQALAITPTGCNPGVITLPINPEYTLVADINVPELNANPLSATDVIYDEGLAIVTYHLNGTDFGGAVDVLNLTNINRPAFTMNYLSELREFNAVALHNEKMYMAGQRNTDESKFTSNNTKGALLYATSLSGDGTFDPSQNWKETPMPSFSGNAIEVLSSGQILFASGATGGGFYKLSSDAQTILESSADEFAKYVNVGDNVEARLTGGNGEAKLTLIVDGQSSEVSLGVSALPVDGKNVVIVDGGMAYVTLGQNGLIVIDVESKEVINQYVPEQAGLTNGVAVDDDFVYLANGESGLLLLRRSNLEFYGQYKYNGSANLVEVVDDIILVANGIGGVKVLLRTDD